MCQGPHACLGAFSLAAVGGMRQIYRGKFYRIYQTTPMKTTSAAVFMGWLFASICYSSKLIAKDQLTWRPVMTTGYYSPLESCCLAEIALQIIVKFGLPYLFLCDG